MSRQDQTEKKTSQKKSPQERLTTQDRKAQIVRATMALLATTPLERLSTRQIAAELGLTQPALFRHFASRDEILLAVLDDIRAQLGELAATVLARDGAATQLRLLMTQLFAFVERHPGLPALLFSSGLPEVGPLRNALKGLMTMQGALVAELFRHGQASGEFDPAVEAEHAATSFVGLIQGLILQWRLTDRQTELGAQAPAHFRLWLDGTRTRNQPTTIGDEDAATAAREDRMTKAPELRALDVRPNIASGDDPQQLIAGHVSELAPGSVLKITAPFRPVPLLMLLSKQGHHAEASELGPKEWSVEVVIGGAPQVEDLRDLEPPEPLERLLTVGEQLPVGGVYLARLPRFPRLLVPHLKERHLHGAIHEEADGSVLIQLVKEAEVHS